jgi:chemotaxis family two-component system response regulator Rcp1
MMQVQPIGILLIEDDPADQKLIRTSLQNQKIANELYVVSSGEEAFDFLQHKGSYGKDTPRPELILLDLNMPGMGGKEFLKLIKEDADLKHIPVLILTTSESEVDIIESYQLQAAGYIHKPITLGGFESVMKQIEEYWFLMCKLPPKE